MLQILIASLLMDQCLTLVIFDLFQKWIVKRADKPELRMKAENPSGKEFINTSRNVAVAIMKQLRNGVKFNATGC